MVPDDSFLQSSEEPGSTPVKLPLQAVAFTPAAGRLPTPKALAEYAAINPAYPEKLIDSFASELRRNYQYQLVALVAGWTFALALAVEAGFLTIKGHDKMALALIGANAVGLATRMLTKAASRG